MTVSPSSLSVQYLKGVGPQRAKALERLGLHTVEDLITRLPRSHEDRRFDTPATFPSTGPLARRGTVAHYEETSAGRNLVMARATLVQGAQRFEALWFRRRSPRFDALATLRKRLTPGTSVAVWGPYQRGPRGLEIRVEDHEAPSPEGPTLHFGRWVPVYALTEGLSASWMREMVWGALSDHAAGLEDPLPPALGEGRPTLLESLRSVHFPADPAAGEAGRRRLAFTEFLLWSLAMAQARARRVSGPPAPACRPTRTLLTPFRARLGFDFTAPQKKVINEIFTDMATDRPMSRLLMGDVGSGKTVVALSALLLAVESGAQAALMAPTEILAEQHALGLERLLKGMPVRWALLRGGTKSRSKKNDLEALARGDISLAVGTHALLQEGVRFHRLGLAVIDEQHRFGVAQRAALAAKGLSPHVLLMTATPIPRTLAMTVYGDLAVSVVDQRPPGRPPIVTQLSSETTAWGAVRRAVTAGRQAYVVFPLVEESEKSDLRAVLAGWKRLSAAVFPDRSVGLLHGRMKSAEKEAAMAAFSSGKTQILCATPVIEVGVDVPNATVMVVLDAERFGLAALHQLRGRVGRGRFPSECHLVPAGGVPTERLRLLCRISDGFRLAEEDLRLRGPGELLGESQHGVPVFLAGDLARDGALISEARHAAETLLSGDPDFRRPEHRPLADALARRFGGRWAFGRVA